MAQRLGVFPRLSLILLREKFEEAFVGAGDDVGGHTMGSLMSRFFISG
jgi:hypothetical protein